MAKYYIVLVFLLCFFSSCSANYLRACYENLSAIYLSERGEMDRALTVFARASNNTVNSKYRSYVEYNIAFLYREIGELGAAEIRLLSIEAGNDKALIYRIYCELGAIAFKKGNFEQAASFFRNAVLINNNDIKLIQNLELALLMIDEDNENREESVNYILPTGNIEVDDARKLLNIMFAGEGLFWMEDTAERGEQGKDW
ncbi:MAG: hypothetical protein FWD87_06435 [Spirochaetaceae bacterium]|nr:hypothetical protein [Spirochaetaceae bacterium]